MDILVEMAVQVGVTYCGPEKVKPYEEAVRAVGLEPVRLIPGESQNLDGLFGLLLTGGADVNPKLYGQTAREETQPPDDRRDEMECGLVGEALAIDLPVLAICRGMQVLNVQLHGSLQQHLSSAEIHVRRLEGQEARKHHAVHTVTVSPGTLLSGIVGTGELSVNSRHHQAVDQLGQGVVAVAFSEDGVVEAIEYPARRFVLGVQWHPEDRIDVSKSDRELFEAFARAVSVGRRSELSR
jgi:putative glutamine amidotransferase